MFDACSVFKVIIFSKLISLIYFNVFIEYFELLMLVSSLIYLGFFDFFVPEIKFSCVFFKLTVRFCFFFFTFTSEFYTHRSFCSEIWVADAAAQKFQGTCAFPSL